MSSIPLSVRLVNARADRHITQRVDDLRFRSSIPGGFASASFTIHESIRAPSDLLTYYTRVYIYDTRTAAVVWEGWVEDLGRSVSRDGSSWQINCVGPAAHARDRVIPVVYVDRNLRAWEETDVTVQRDGSVTLPSDHGTNPPMHMQFPDGSTLAANSRVVRAYPLLRRTGQKLARFGYGWDTGMTSASWRVQALPRGGVNPPVNASDVAANTAGGSVMGVIVTDYDNDRDWLDVRLLWNAGATTVVGDNEWAELSDLYVQGTRWDYVSGVATELLTAASYTVGTIQSSTVVRDLLARVLPLYDGANASIHSTSFGIEQLAYPDPVTAAKILDDLMLIDADHYWAAWEANSAGLYRFEWSAWPGAVRYEADVADGFRSPGSASELYNAVRVRYREADGTISTVQRTSSVPVLTAAGRTREAFLDLGDDLGSVGDAQRAGDQFLSEHSYPPNAGVLRIRRPVQDLVSGRMVAPWEIRPGSLWRVRGVTPAIDALNASSRDGVAVFRGRSVDFSADNAEAAVELDSYTQTSARQVADLIDRPNHRRR